MENENPLVVALRALCKRVGGSELVAAKAKVSAANLKQILAGTELPSGNLRGVGPDLRKKLTKAYPDWLEVTASADITIPQFKTGGSMGNGLILRDQPGIIQGWNVNREWVQKNVPSNSGTGNLCIVTGFGPSMRPLFNPGDPLLVDCGVVKVEVDAVYFFRVGEEGFIKSLQRIPGEGLRVISANREHFDPWTIKPDMDFEVFGRVLKVWRGEEF